MHSCDPIESQVRECYGRVVYSHKTHEKRADVLLKRLGIIKLLQIVLSSISTAGFLTTLIGGAERIGSMIGASFSAILLCLTLYTKNYDLGELAQKHRRAAADLWFIREKYLSLITDLRTGQESPEKITARRNALLEELTWYLLRRTGAQHIMLTRKHRRHFSKMKR